MRHAILVLAGLMLTAGLSLAKVHRYDLDETYAISPGGTLYLETDDADVVLTASDRKDVHLKVHHELRVSGLSLSEDYEFAVDVREVDGDLRIREISESSFSFIVGSVNERYTVEIEAPAGVHLRLRGDDDDYRITGFAGDVRLDFEDGDAVLREMTGSHFEFGCEDGAIDMIGGSGLLDVYMEDGDLTVEQGAFDDVTISMEDGAAFLATRLATDGNYRMRADDGDLRLMVLDGGGEFYLEFDDGRSRVGDQFTLEEESELSERYTLPGGNAEVRMRVEDGRITLRKR